MFLLTYCLNNMFNMNYNILKNKLFCIYCLSSIDHKINPMNIVKIRTLFEEKIQLRRENHRISQDEPNVQLQEF